LLKVVAGIGFAFEEVTTPSVVTMAPEGITHSAAVFTGNQNPHSKSGGESLKCVHGGGAGGLGSVALSVGRFALEAVVVDAGCVLALSVEVAELLDLSGGHWIELLDV
jgi:hypothetical protein